MDALIEQLKQVHEDFVALLPERDLTPEDTHLIVKELLKYKDHEDPNFIKMALVATACAKRIPYVQEARVILIARMEELLGGAAEGRARAREEGKS